MILLAVKFTEGKLPHGEEHKIGLALRDSLLSLLGPVGGYEFALKGAGKPYVVGSPVTYSVSHTAGCVACALSTPHVPLTDDVPEIPQGICRDGIWKMSDVPCASDIGFDVELLDTDKSIGRLCGIAERFFSREEKRIFEAAEDKHTAFFRIWTGKESIIKCSGEGMAGIENADTCKSRTGQRVFVITMSNKGSNFVSSLCIDTL